MQAQARKYSVRLLSVCVLTVRMDDSSRLVPTTRIRLYLQRAL
jgi:hypothetical protein